MRKALKLMAMTAFIAAVSLTGVPQLRVWAQGPVNMEGIYLLQNRCRYDLIEGSCRPWNIPQGMSKEFYMTRDRVYVWYKDRGEYRISSVPNEATLCSEYGASTAKRIPSANPPQLTIEPPRQGDVQFRYTFSYQGPLGVIGLPKLEELNHKERCSGARRVPATGGLVAAGGQGWPSLLALQTPAPSGRTLDGQVLLALDSKATEDDKRLWACMVTRGYPSVEFTAQGTPPQREFVWPDGHFRTQLKGGATYGWRLISAECEIQAAQPGDQILGVLRVPAAAARTDERILLACFVSRQQGFTGCDEWFLIRP